MFRRVILSAATLCLVMAIAIVALMVRSYWRADSLGYADGKGPPNLSADSIAGYVSVGRTWAAFYHGLEDGYWRRSEPLTADALKSIIAEQRASFEFDGLYALLVLPHWVPITAFGAIGLLLTNGRAAFSLRTALISITAFALLLGLNVGLQRAFS